MNEDRPQYTYTVRRHRRGNANRSTISSVVSGHSAKEAFGRHVAAEAGREHRRSLYGPMFDAQPEDRYIVTRNERGAGSGEDYGIFRIEEVPTPQFRVVDA